MVSAVSDDLMFLEWNIEKQICVLLLHKKRNYYILQRFDAKTMCSCWKGSLKVKNKISLQVLRVEN